ncbi:MAG: biotin--[Ruminococcus sp.]|nr:biotin--[acetyl-CoA-carboxylase] ligase [Ruminococcus sp.]
MLNEEKLLSAAGDCGCVIHIVPETGSTNDDLKAMAAYGAPDGTVIVTDKQKNGKGRMGRSFFSPRSGVYLSMLLRPEADVLQSLHYTVVGAVAVCRTIEKISGRKAQIKWVNDVYVDGKKVCGILAEGSVSGDRPDWIIVGIGTNITPPEGGFPPDIASRAGALFEDGDAPRGISELYAAELIRELRALMSLSRETVDEVIAEYRERSLVIGRDIIAVTPAGERPCRAVGVTDAAELMVEYPDGKMGILFSGEVSLKL